MGSKWGGAIKAKPAAIMDCSGAYVISWRFDYAKYRCDKPDADIICIIIMDIMYVVRFI